MIFFKNLFEGGEKKRQEVHPNKETSNSEEENEVEFYGIDRENAHERALELIPEDFFWDCTDEFSPFGSDEGDMALSEFRSWRKENPNRSTYECLKWTIEDIGEIEISDYNKNILNKERIQMEVNNPNFDDDEYIYTLDISVIATGFGELVDEGTIDIRNKEIIKLAINRQKIWVEFSEIKEYKEEYIKRLEILERILIEA